MFEESERRYSTKRKQIHWLDDFDLMCSVRADERKRESASEDRSSDGSLSTTSTAFDTLVAENKDREERERKSPFCAPTTLKPANEWKPRHRDTPTRSRDDILNDGKCVSHLKKAKSAPLLFFFPFHR